VLLYSLFMEKMLNSIIIRQLPFLIGGTITVIIITYYFGFFFSIIAPSSHVFGSTDSSSDCESITFAALGDWGCSEETTEMANMIEEIDPDLVLGLGDYVFDNNTSCYFDMIERFADKIKIAFGKHDVDSQSVF
jgi:hypothetical protein